MLKLIQKETTMTGQQQQQQQKQTNKKEKELYSGRSQNAEEILCITVL